MVQAAIKLHRHQRHPGAAQIEKNAVRWETWLTSKKLNMLWSMRRALVAVSPALFRFAVIFSSAILRPPDRVSGGFFNVEKQSDQTFCPVPLPPQNGG